MVCVVSEQIFFALSINLLDFITDTKCVNCAVRTESLNTVGYATTNDPTTKSFYQKNQDATRKTDTTNARAHDVLAVHQRLGPIFCFDLSRVFLQGAPRPLHPRNIFCFDLTRVFFTPPTP